MLDSIPEVTETTAQVTGPSNISRFRAIFIKVHILHKHLILLRNTAATHCQHWSQNHYDFVMNQQI